MKVVVHIDRLSVEGASFGALGRARLQAALEQRLAELIRSAGPALLTELESQAAIRLDAAPIALGMSPAALGSGIADSLHQGLCGPKAGAR